MRLAAYGQRSSDFLHTGLGWSFPRPDVDRLELEGNVDEDEFRADVRAQSQLGFAGDLESVAGDVAIVQATLDSIPGDKILVGHSYGGFVITNAATGRGDVRGLVYTAA